MHATDVAKRTELVELMDAEIDLVSGGQPQIGLVNVNNALNNNRVNVGLQVAVGVLSGIIQRGEQQA